MGASQSEQQLSRYDAPIESGPSSTGGAPAVEGGSIPYTFYSVDRNVLPLNAKESRGQSLVKQQSLPAMPHGRASATMPPRGVSPQPHASPKVGSADHRIVTVSAGGQGMDQSLSYEIQKMRDIPTFLPILKGGHTIHHSEDPSQMEKMDHRQLLQLCLRYQQHLRQCAEAVTFDQGAITGRIKEVDAIIHSIMQSMAERQKRFAKHAEQIQRINEMSGNLKRIQMSVDQLVPLMDRLNNVLPEGERLETFTMRPTGPRT